MADRSEVRAGIFVVSALAILALGTLWILGSPLGGDQRDFEIQMKSSGGVRRGDRVRLSGIEVGRVRELELLPGDERPVLFRVAIDREVELTDGSTARLTTDGLLGAPYLELVAGPPEAPVLSAGSRIVGAESSDINQALDAVAVVGDRMPELLDQASGTLARVEAEVEPLLASLQRLLSDENVDTMSRVITKLEPTIEEVGERLTALAEHLDELATELGEGLGGVPELSTELRGLVGDLRAAVGEDGSRLAGVLDAADQTIGTADGALATLELNAEEIDATFRDLREAAANLRSMTQSIKERPSLLLRRPAAPEREPGEENR